MILDVFWTISRDLPKYLQKRAYKLENELFIQNIDEERLPHEREDFFSFDKIRKNKNHGVKSQKRNHHLNFL